MHSSLNRFFRVVWCKVRLTWVAVSEASSGRGKQKSTTRSSHRSGASTPQSVGENTRAHWHGAHLRLVPLPRLQPTGSVHLATWQAISQLDVPRSLMTSALLTGGAVAAQTAPHTLPTGGQVHTGQASISQSGANMLIHQSSDRAAIHWQSFNLGKDAHVQFQQPSAQSVTLNRVQSTDPSQIFGRISANGQVILSNPAGVYFVASARVDVGGLLATTHGIGDADFMAGHQRYERHGSTGSVVNEGELKAALGGYIALLAPEVRNQGAVIAHMGTVAMAGGEAIDLSFDSNNRLTRLRVQPSQIQALVDNQHAVQAPGGLVIISAQSMDRLVGGVVKNSGTIEATGLQQQGGRMVLSGSSKTVNSGTLNVSNTQGSGGSVSMQGEHIELKAGSRIDATGSQGGGTVLVGGNWQGTADPLLQATGQPSQQATTVTMDATATIDASATDKGKGGTVVLWSDITQAPSVTTVRGTIFAKGGEQGGDGGRIETSGGLLVTDGVRGSAAATSGKAGEWLFDPTNVTIGTSGAASEQNNGSSLSANAIADLLNGGTSVTVTTYSGGNDLGDLSVNSSISKSSGSNDVTLTLRAANSIVINQAITQTGGTGKLNVVIDADNNTTASTAGTAPVRDGGGIVILEANVSTGGGSVTFGGTEANGFNGGDLFVGGSSGITIGTSGGAVDVKGNLIIANSSAEGFTIHSAGGEINLRRAVDSGNQYTAVFGTRDWQQAFDHARTQPNAWMATVGSSLENALAIRAAGYRSAWLGGQRIIGTNLWQWTADPAYSANTNPMTFFYQGATTQTQLDGAASGAGGTTASGYFANWSGWTNGSIAVSEPNNWNGSGAGIFSQDNEAVLQFTGSQGKWNDLPRTAGYTLDRYVLETNLAPSRLTLNAGAGAVNIGAGVGFSKALSQLSVTASSTSVTGGGVITTGAQSYSSGLAVESSGRVNISGTTVTTQGPVSVKSTANDVYLNAAFTNTAMTASSFNVQAARHIQLSSSASIVSSTAAMNTSLWADTDKSGDGIVYFEGSGIDTKGGNLTFGKEGQNNILGGTASLVGGDVFFQRGSAQTLTTAGGDVNIYGETIVANTAGLNIQSSNGNITLHGLLNSGNQYTWVNKVGSSGAGSWDEARTEAKNGTSGDASAGSSYLVNITSRLENAISGLTAGYQGAWIGAYRPNTTNHNWAWADGPEAGQTFFTQNSTGGGGVATTGYYANFGTDEPNGRLSATRANEESAGQFFGSAGLWNDLRHTNTYASNASVSPYAVKGFVRETNLAGSPVVINAGTGAVQIKGGVGTAKALTSLNVTASGTTVTGNGLITTGPQTYSTSLTVNDSNDVQAVNLQAGAEGITVGGAMTVYGGAFEAIQINTDITSTASGDLQFLGTDSTGWSVRLAPGKTITKSAGTGTLTFAGPGRIMSEGTVQATGTAQLNVVMSSETDNGNNYGVGTGAITSNGGNVWIGGGSLTNTWNGIAVGSRWASGTNSGGNANAIDVRGNITTNGGDVLMAGWTTHPTASDIAAVGAPRTISAGSGSVTLLTRSSKFAASTTDDKTTIHTTGTLTLAPLSGQGYGLLDLTVNGTSAAGQFTGTDDLNGLVIPNVSNLTGLVLGSYLGTGVAGDSAYTDQINASTTVNSAFSINGPISVLGTDVLINANLSSTAAGAGILAKGTGHITQAAQIGVTTNGGSVSYWADADNNSTGSIRLMAGTSGNRTTISTGGGAITMGGGSNAATDSAWGTGSTFEFQHGINLDSFTSLDAGSGAVSLRGASSATRADYVMGVRVYNNSTISGGNMNIVGESTPNDTGNFGQKWGVGILNGATITGSGAVSITGIGGGANSMGGNNHGVFLEANSSIIGTGSAAVTISGTSGNNNAVSVNVHDGSVIRSGAGTLTVIGRGNGPDGAGGMVSLHGSAGFTTTLGSSTASEQSGDISLRADTLYANSGGGTNQVLGTGSLTIEPLSASFNQNWIGTSGLSLGNTLSGFTLGKLGNTADLTVNSGWGVRVAGPVALYGGNIAIHAGLTSTGTGVNARITLKATGNVTDGDSGFVQSGSDGNGSLLLLGGQVTLDNSASNDVYALAASGVGGLTYLDKAGLMIGSVGAVNGVSATGVVNIGTQTGSLSITQSVTTTDASSNALTLSASMGSAVASDTSYNLLISGAPTLAVGNGGTGKLYTGGINDSTGLTALVGSGSGRFRYNAKPGSHNFSAALGSGLYAIYREQPSLTVTADSQTITYGDSPALTTSSSGTVRNGDTLAMAVPNLPTATVHDAANSDPAITAGANSTQHYDGGNYTLRVGTMATHSALGYALTSATGTLTVNKKDVTITADNAAKIYSLGDPSLTVSYTGLAAGETSITDGTRTINRTITGDPIVDGAVGNYAITASGAASTNNYAITYVPGNFTIAPVEKLLVTVGQTTVAYGTEAVYTATSAKYVSGTTEIPLALTDPVGGANDTFNFTDGSSNTITLKIDGSGARNSSGFFNVGTRGLQALQVVESNPGIAGITDPEATISGSLNVTPKVLSLSGTKVYDGNRSLSGSISTGVSTETLTYINAQANSANVASAAYFTAMTLSNGSNGGLSSNYLLPDLTQASAGNAVAITRRGLALSGTTVYDGTTVLGSSSVGFTAIGGNANSGLVAGETLRVSAATGSDAHVATANKYISSITLADANGLVGNYSIQGLSPTAGNALTGLSHASDNSLSVEARTLAVSVTNTNVSKVYDGTDHAKVGTGASAHVDFMPAFSVANLVTGDSLSLNYSAAYNSADVVSANAIHLSGIAVGGVTGTASSATSDYALNTTATVAASITPRPVAVSGTGVSKVYDGTTSMNQVSLGFSGVPGQAESGVVTGQSLTVSGGTGTFSSALAGTDKSYSLSGFTLSSGASTQASNYSLPGGGGATLRGDDGVIYQRPLAVTFGANAKVYDGTPDATVTVSYANTAYAPVILNGVTDDVVINRNAAYDNKNVGSGSTRVAISGVSLSGTDAANYTLSYSAADPLNSPTVGRNAGYISTTSGQITPLGSATWVGSTTGNWFDPANWAASHNLSLTGVVPDLANVATVVIPSGVSVAFNGTGSGLAVANQAVSITDLQGSGATLNVSTGTLTIGASGATLAGLAQTGGAIDSTGVFTVSDAFSQTAGSLSSTGSGAHIHITQAMGDLRWVQLASGGDLTIRSAGKTTLGATQVGGNLLSTTSGAGLSGGVTQTGALVVEGTSTFVANGGTLQDALLNNAANDFTAAVSMTTANNGSWRNVALTDANALTLGTVITTGDLTLNNAGVLNLGNSTAGGHLNANSHGGAIVQTGPLTVTGDSTFNAGAGHITLNHASNDFGGTVNATGGNVTLRDINTLSLGDVTADSLRLDAGDNIALNGNIAADTLNATADGSITQGNTSVIAISGPANLVAGDSITLNGDLTAGNTTLLAQNDVILNGSLDVASLDVKATVGEILQTGGTVTVRTGPTHLSAEGDISLAQANDFNGTVNASGQNIKIQDTNSLVMGDLLARANLDLQTNGALALGKTIVGGDFNAETGDGRVTQTDKLTVVGKTEIDAGQGSVSLTHPDNNIAGGVLIQAGSVSVVGDKQGDAAAAAAAAAEIQAAADKAAVEKAVADKALADKAAADKAASDKTLADKAAADKAAADKALADKAAADKAAADQAAAEPSAIAFRPVQVDAASRPPLVSPSPDLLAQSIRQPTALAFGTNTPATPQLQANTTANTANPVKVAGPSAGLRIDVMERPAANLAFRLDVSLPTEMVTAGQGFTFELPASVKSLVQTDTTVQITQSNGDPLPDWLQFMSSRLSFEAMRLPPNALPLQLIMQIGQERVQVMISQTGK